VSTRRRGRRPVPDGPTRRVPPSAPCRSA